LAASSDDGGVCGSYRRESETNRRKECEMPRYLDRHPTNPNMPPELVAEIMERLRSGRPDEFGEKGLNVFIGAEETYCHTDAPNPEAVRMSHAALGITLGTEDVIEVQVLP
jgi:hypothetical protein